MSYPNATAPKPPPQPGDCVMIYNDPERKPYVIVKFRPDVERVVLCSLFSGATAEALACDLAPHDSPHSRMMCHEGVFIWAF